MCIQVKVQGALNRGFFCVFHSCYSFLSVVRRRNHGNTREFREMSRNEGSGAQVFEGLEVCIETWELGSLWWEAEATWRGAWKEREGEVVKEEELSQG